MSSRTVGTAQLVGRLEDLQGAGDGLALTFELNGNTLGKVDSEASGLVGSVQGIFGKLLAQDVEVWGSSRLTNCALPHVLRGLHVGLLENLAASGSIGSEEGRFCARTYTGLV
jgi:hypothetical protein